MREGVRVRARVRKRERLREGEAGRERQREGGSSTLAPCPRAARAAARLVPLLQPLGLRVLIEPGRFIVGNAGALVTRVEYVKKTGKKNFVIVDAAMNDLIRPAFYDSYHEIVPLAKKPGGKIPTDVVGGICEWPRGGGVEYACVCSVTFFGYGSFCGCVCGLFLRHSTRGSLVRCLRWTE